MKDLSNIKADSKFIKEGAENKENEVISKKDSRPQKPNSTTAVSFLQKIARRGNIAKHIPDPVSWQKEIRKDRKLPLRNN